METLPTKQLTVVCCVHNNLSLAQPSLTSLRNNTDVDAHFILIDCFSHDPNTRSFLKSFINPGDWLWDYGEDIGQVASLNNGFARAETEFIVKFDDDVVLPRNWASLMIKAWKSIPNIGLLALDLDWGKVYSSYINHRIDNISFDEMTWDGVPDDQKHLRFPVWGCMMISKDIYKRFGPFDYNGVNKHYGGDELFFCRKIREAGLKQGYLTNVKGTHLSKNKSEHLRKWQIQASVGHTNLNYVEWSKTNK